MRYAIAARTAIQSNGGDGEGERMEGVDYDREEARGETIESREERGEGALDK